MLGRLEKAGLRNTIDKLNKTVAELKDNNTKLNH